MTLRRKYEEKFFRVLSALFTLVIVFVLAHIIWSIVEKGFSSLSLVSTLVKKVVFLTPLQVLFTWLFAQQYLRLWLVCLLHCS